MKDILIHLTDQKIVDLYTKLKYSCRDIAKIDERSESTIYFILKKNSVVLRNKSDANKIFSDLILISLYNLGLSSPQISEILGIHQTTIIKRFKKIKFPLRTRDNAKAIGYTREEFRKYFFNIKDIVREILWQ